MGLTTSRISQIHKKGNL
ncbi:hypothetical protein RWE15_21240 [Virgibacillus halophilus]|uniref:Uncharacterized protein n=1 Tax=Tigheibacillus halophilus TaxID=361280 RepID=A0ABU5CAM5_9BACI|nr:hypothetical protein [Virgibacillus halophilus]